MVMELVRGKQRGTTNGFKIVQLVIFAIIVGLSELSAQQPPAPQTYPPKDLEAFLRDWEVVKHRTRAHLGSVRWLIVVIVGIWWAVACHMLFSSPTTAEGADAEPSWRSRREPAATLAESIYRLPVYVSVLHTAAHPDDENNALLAYLARGVFARTAYLSLTRGDGGQNRIGPELFEALGVIRTEELLAARRLDGAAQYFTRAFDFGFSKSRAEALSKWNRDEVLADMVRVIRTFRPLVIVSAWTGTPSDGHGHHQAAGFLTKEAYTAAADPSRYPQQLAEGLRPWQAKKLYIRVPTREELPKGVEPITTTVTLNKGQFDQLLGRSYYEIAMAGRSQHRSQDQGALERRGPQYTRLHLEQSTVGSPKEEKDIFDRIDTGLPAIAQFAGQATARLKEPLADAQQAADEAMAKYNPLK